MAINSNPNNLKILHLSINAGLLIISTAAHTAEFIPSREQPQSKICNNGVIGLPNSAQSLMFQQDFDMGGVALDEPTEETKADALPDESIQNDAVTPKKASTAEASSMSLGASYSGIGNTDAVVIPIDYKQKLDNGSELLLNLPVMYIEHSTPTNSSAVLAPNGSIKPRSFNIGDDYITGFDTTTYTGASLGAGYKLPVSKWVGMKNEWALTPLARIGGVVSDASSNSSAIIYSGGALSEYDLKVAGGVLGIKNMVSYYGISPLNVHNAIFRNGVYYARYLGPQLWGRKLSGTLFFTDTRFAGSALYMDSMQQVGFNFGLAPKRSKTGSFIRRTIDAQDIRLGMTYTYSTANRSTDPNLEGFAVNLGYSF